MLATAAVADTGNVLIDGLTWGTKWVSASGPLVIKVGVRAGSLLPTQAEINAVHATLAEFERVINVDFQFVGLDTAGTADLTFNFYNDPASYSYGWSVPAGEGHIVGFGDVNILRNNYADPTSGFAPGSFDRISFVHEFAHVMGLAHPHDSGGGSGIFPGVTGPSSLGSYQLNQGVYTTMTLNDGRVADIAGGISAWYFDDAQDTFITQASAIQSHGGLATDSYGLQSGLMALDIMALQNLYGANTTSAAGDNVYVLPTANELGTAYKAIWDTGGTDRLVMPGTQGSILDLRAATGQVALGGGGFVSTAFGISGGFTIAAGVIIENATGNAGDDKLIGNAAANRLEGAGGADSLTGFGGKDSLWGGAGRDVFVFTSELDSGPTILSADVIGDFNADDDFIDLVGVDAHTGLAGNQAFSWGGFISSFTAASQVRGGYSSGNTVLYLNTDADMSTESVIVLNGLHVLSADDFLL